MSAYVVDKEHVIYIAQVAEWLASRDRYGEHPKFRRPVAEIAQLLWNENVRSVEYRYGKSEPLPGPIDTSNSYQVGPVHRLPLAAIDHGQAFKSIGCLEYQSCETPDWDQTEAYLLLREMRETLPYTLPTYESAVWGAPPVVVTLDPVRRVI